MKLLQLLLFALLIASRGMAQDPVRVDSLSNPLMELKQQNIEIRRELSETKREVALYHDMFKQQWTFFWVSITILGILVAVAGYFTIRPFIKKIDKAVHKVHKVDQSLKRLSDDITDISIGNKMWEGLLTHRIYNINRYLEILKTEYDGWFPILRINEYILSNYLAYKSNPENESLLTDLFISIGQTYNAIRKIESNVIKFTSLGSPFTGKEYGISELQHTLHMIIKEEDGEIRNSATKASEMLNQTINSLMAEAANERA